MVLNICSGWEPLALLQLKHFLLCTPDWQSFLSLCKREICKADFHAVASMRLEGFTPLGPLCSCWSFAPLANFLCLEVINTFFISNLTLQNENCLYWPQTNWR